MEQFGNNNPFLEDILAEQDEIASLSSRTSSASFHSADSSHTLVMKYKNITLPPFYADRPISWFAMAEGRFRLNNVWSEQNKFDLLINALPKESTSLVIDIIENPPATEPYAALKQRLLSAHQLTDYQKIAKLLKMEPLGGRRPSELLAAMMELCPRGQERNIFFTHLFLERLPAELRILLGEDDHQDPRPLADKADQLWALHGGKFAAVAAVEPVEPAQVAAVSSRGAGRGKRGRGGPGRQRAVAVADGALQAAAKPATAPRDLAQLESGLCFYHWTYGDKALQCRAPCNWGN